jgi:hypothetical protein
LRLLDCVPEGHPKTVGADKAYDTRDFVSDCRARNVTPHVARNDERSGGSAIDGRSSRHQARRPALQVDNGGEQSDLHGPNNGCGTESSGEMSCRDACATRRDATTRERGIGKMRGASGFER